MELKSQSAMEYLMTYGWAILIIAVVLSVLFQLGVFSSGNFQPHAQAGACQVSRTVAGVSLEGQCNGLLPEFVANFNGQGFMTLTGLDWSYPQVTTTMWVYFPQSFLSTPPADGYYGVIGGYDSSTGQCLPFSISMRGTTGPDFCASNTISSTLCSFSPSNPALGTWAFVTGRYNGTDVSTWINGVPDSGGAIAPMTGSIVNYNLNWVGAGECGTYNFQGELSNVQVYNTSLSASEIQSLYLEGIGGAPIRPQNLVAWWPLNGNLNDYSGNGYNGQDTYNGVQFSSSWESGYTPP